MTWRTALVAVLARELRAAARNRTYPLLALAVTLATFGAALAGTGPGAGYIPTVVDLLVPVEVLVPAIAFAVGYRAIVDDAVRGELAVLRTYPVPAWTYIGGVYLGRLAVLVGVVLVPLSALGVYVALAATPGTTIFATHRGIDSPALYARFLALTAVLAASTLAVAVAASALSRSRRRAIVFALAGLLLVVAGADLTVLRALEAGLIGEGALRGFLGASPTSAYRGLVFETVVSVAFERDTGYVAPWMAAAGLLVWTAGSLIVATVAIRWR